MQQLPGDKVTQNLGTPVSNNSENSIVPSTGGDMKSNVSSFIPPNVGNTLSQIQNPTAFGDQLANQAKQQVIGVILGPIQKLKTEIEKVISDRIRN